MMSPSEVLRALAAAVQRRDADALAALYAEDAVLYHPLTPGGVRGRDAIAASEQGLFDAFSDVEVELRSVLEGGSECAGELLIHATNTGPLDLAGETIPPTGRRVELPSVWWLTLRGDGLITEERDYMDAAGFMTQLGLARPG